MAIWKSNKMTEEFVMSALKIAFPHMEIKYKDVVQMQVVDSLAKKTTVTTVQLKSGVTLENTEHWDYNPVWNGLNYD